MANPIDSPPHKTRKLYYATQISLRVFAVVVTLAAAWLMIANKQSTVVYGIKADSRYTYVPAFKFLVIANVVALAFSVVSLVLVFVLGKLALDPEHFYVFFLHDLMVTLLLMASCGASTAVAYVGKYGNSRVGWIAICEHFDKFCSRGQASIIITYLGFLIYLLLTLVSAKKLLHVQPV